ncbi:MAG: M48 family metalloprotease [Gammaproteobacteria bacterium]
MLTNLGREHVLAVMGHEMNHYVLRPHVEAAGRVFWTHPSGTLCAVHRSFGFLMQRYPQRFGFSDLPTSLPLLVLLISLFFLLAQPIALAVSRQFEREADRFGRAIPQNNRATASALALLHDENLPHPWPGPL